MKTGILTVIIILVIALIGGVIGWSLHFPNLGANETYVDVRYAGDLIGTRTGTSTSYAYYTSAASGFVATSTYIKRINGGYDEATFDIQSGLASSTANVWFNFFGSNDEDCDTASTTGGKLNNATMTDMNWFDIGYNLKGKTNTASISTATTTFPWLLVTSNSGKAITFTDIQFECLRVDVSAASTTLFAQLRLK